MIYIVLLNLECESNYFGLDCKERCISHCKNSEPCNHVSGRCPDGCQDGFMDEYCNSCKKPALSLMTFYTLNCLFLQNTVISCKSFTIQCYALVCNLNDMPRDSNVML